MTRPHILDIVESAGFRVFENGDYNLNIIGVRTPLGAAVPNRFDDVMHLVYKENGKLENTVENMMHYVNVYPFAFGVIRIGMKWRKKHKWLIKEYLE